MERGSPTGSLAGTRQTVASPMKSGSSLPERHLARPSSSFSDGFSLPTADMPVNKPRRPLPPGRRTHATGYRLATPTAPVGPWGAPGRRWRPWSSRPYMLPPLPTWAFLCRPWANPASIGQLSRLFRHPHRRRRPGSMTLFGRPATDQRFMAATWPRGDLAAFRRGTAGEKQAI